MDLSFYNMPYIIIAISLLEKISLPLFMKPLLILQQVTSM